MKDYTISHPCGLEKICPTKRQARKEAKAHFNKCENKTDEVFIDEYDHELGEMTGNYSKVSF